MPITKESLEARLAQLLEDQQRLKSQVILFQGAITLIQEQIASLTDEESSDSLPIVKE